MFTNTLKRKLQAGEHCFGILDSTCSAEIVEMIGYLGYDFVLLDAEHGKLTLENLEHLIRAAELSGTAPIMRPPVTKGEFISPALYIVPILFIDGSISRESLTWVGTSIHALTPVILPPGFS